MEHLLYVGTVATMWGKAVSCSYGVYRLVGDTDINLVTDSNLKREITKLENLIKGLCKGFCVGGIDMWKVSGSWQVKGVQGDRHSSQRTRLVQRPCRWEGGTAGKQRKASVGGRGWELKLERRAGWNPRF